MPDYSTNKPRAKKALGQNFLVDPTVCPRIAAHADIEEIGVLEIGPGLGALTKELCPLAKKVVAIEIDEDVLPTLRQTLTPFDNVDIVVGDALKMDLGKLIRESFGNLPVAIVGNLPYYITSPLLVRFLEEGLPIRSVTILVQKEAAVRFCAPPGSRDCGAISALVWYRSEPRMLFDVKPGAFRPIPKVTSSAIHLRMREQPAVAVPDEAFFFRMIRTSFGQRRKTLVNALNGFEGWDKGALNDLLAEMGWDTAVRAEALSLEDFAYLCRELWAHQKV